MEFTVSKLDLVRELNLLQGVVEKRTTIPILSNVLIEAGQDRLILTATDLELGIRCECPAQIKKAGSGTIPARRLLDYVRLLPEADVQVKFAENHWASLTCGRSRTRIAGMSRESYPELPDVPEPIAQIPAGPLASLIARTVFAISLEESRFTLNGAQMILRPTGITLVSTDGHRLALAEHSVELGPVAAIRALLPRKAMNEITRLAQEAGPDARIEFAVTENHLFFRLGTRLLLSRKLTGTFPDYERVLPKEHPYNFPMPKDELRGALERVAQFSDDRSHAIRLKVAPGEIKVHSSLSETGESEETLAAPYDGPEIDIGFNAHYLVDFLRVIGEPEARVFLRDAGSAGEFRPGGDGSSDNYRYVVMPMRI
jgi:DNA polymerase-3 subunit beta